jgi:hypothetical protein
LAVGDIGPGQLRVITETLGALPASVAQPARRAFDPRRLRIIAHRLLACLDPDGSPRTMNPRPHRRPAASCGCASGATGVSGWKAG